MFLDTSQIVELLGFFFGIAFLVLLLRENIWCWLMGIVSSGLSIYLFISVKLYSEAILSSYYVIIGVYGWYTWATPKDGKTIPIQEWALRINLFFVALGACLASGLGYFFDSQTDAESPYLDASTTIFSFIAGYLEVHKVISTWYFWIIINGVSIGLYLSRGLEYYAAMMAVYFLLSVWGLIKWRGELNTRKK